MRPARVVGWALPFAVLLLVTLVSVQPAAALPEPSPGTTGCGTCHSPLNVGVVCERCHQYKAGDGSALWYGAPYFPVGPHGAYSSTTDRCPKCHTLHDAPTSLKLLPGATIKATCFACHDGTGGDGVYGALAARGVAVGGGHQVESTSVVPGGSAATGGDITVAFRGPGGTMTCSDCHSPHATNVVAPFNGERIRIWSNGTTYPAPRSSRLLKKRPTGASGDVSSYGSDWCMACHNGRGSGGMVMNHPVESLQTNASPYTYERAPVNLSNDVASLDAGVPAFAPSALLSSLGVIRTQPVHFDWGNYPNRSDDMWASGWLMTYPRNWLQAGHAPLCQQCHEDSRNVGELRADGTQAWIREDGVPPNRADGRVVDGTTANPRFQNFPHETENAQMLIETGDNLCLNCHPPTRLP